MRNVPITLRFGADRDTVAVRELTGADEQRVTDTATSTALALLDGVLVDGPPATSLTATDRDRLLAAAHRLTFGDRVEGTVGCAACGEPFDVDFALFDLEAAQAAGTTAPEVAVRPDGVVTVAGTARCRLPTGGDELAVAHLPAHDAAAALAGLLAVGDTPAGEVEGLLDAARPRAPLLDTEIDATCPECDATQQVRFDVQRHLLGRLATEHDTLLAEIHVLASAYRWAPADILRLPRRDRRRLVEHVVDDAERARR